MMTVWAVLGGFVLDALFGDPAWLPHPVVYMGKAISRLEKFLRSRLPKTPQGELLGGAVVAFCLPVGTLAVHGPCLLGHGDASPAAGAGRPDVLVRPGAGRKGAWRRRARMSMTSCKKAACPPPARR